MNKYSSINISLQENNNLPTNYQRITDLVHILNFVADLSTDYQWKLTNGRFLWVNCYFLVVNLIFI